MQRIKPIGLNLRKTDYEIEDGFLQESINLQWRDNALRPIPQRIETNISVHGLHSTIMHKVGDENTVNVLAFSALSGSLLWIGVITDGVYVAKSSPSVISGVVYTLGMSYVILNGLIYFMGDGSNSSEKYYYQLKYNESDGIYEVKDIYGWKSTTPKFVTENFVHSQYLADGPYPYNFASAFTIGIVLVRYALVLNTGEIVLHTPVYVHDIKGLVLSTLPANGAVPAGTVFKNIHTKIDLRLFDGLSINDEDIASVNVYVSIPYYESQYDETHFTLKATEFHNNGMYFIVVYSLEINSDIITPEVKKLMDTGFYLVKTIDVAELENNNSLYVCVPNVVDYDMDGYTSGDIIEENIIDMSTIAAGELMPTDNFSWHKLYGKLTTYNGALVISQPTTVLDDKIWEEHLYPESEFHANANAKTAFTLNSEDGVIKSSLRLNSEGKMPILNHTLLGSNNHIAVNTVLSYPDYRATRILFNAWNPDTSSVVPTSNNYYLIDLTKKANLNIACNTEIALIEHDDVISINVAESKGVIEFCYHSKLIYQISNVENRVSGIEPKYVSNNRIQFTEVGEYSVFPALKSYRIGEGSIMSVGSNTIVPNETFIVAPLIVGTTDGVYSMNTDSTGNNFIASITKVANIPFISDKTLLIGDAIIFVSDKGLMAIQNSGIINLTEKFFPDRGNGDFPDQNTVYPNYDLLTLDFFGSGGNTMEIIDIVQYMRGAIFAYDSRRENLWCCNSSYSYSLVYNLQDSQWTMSLIKFIEVAELFGIYKDGDNEIYSRYLIRNTSKSSNYLHLLSGEDNESMVKYHLLTRPIKLQTPNDFKKINRFYSRCEIYDNPAKEGYFVCGLWGKQDTNKTRKAQNLIAIKGSFGTNSIPDGIRQDIPIGRLSGKYKTIIVLQGGYSTPDSSINSFDFNVSLVINNINK